jgi:hypothetical protein
MFILAIFIHVDKAYAWQEVAGAKVVGLGCYPGDNTCFVKIDRDHHITTETAKCKKRYFAWDSSAPNAEQFYNLAEKAYDDRNRVSVLIRYSEYQCFNTSQGPYMSVIFIILE